MDGHKSASKSSHRRHSEYADAEDTYYSETPSSDTSMEGESTSGTVSRNSSRLSQIRSIFGSFKDRKEDQSGSSPTPNSDENPSPPRRILNSIRTRILGAFSYLWNAVKELFSKRGTKKVRKRRLTFQSDYPDPVIAEIHATRDKIYWKRDNKTSVFKRDPEKCTVFEIKQDDDSDKEQLQKQKPSIPKAKETTPLGTTVYRQPARGICIGTEQISGAVKVVLDYTRKRAFVQIISRKSEVYATYTVNSITFLATCTPFGVAWIGDTFKPEDGLPVSKTKRKQSSFSEQRESSYEDLNQSFDIERNQDQPPDRRSDSVIQADPEEIWHDVPESRTGTEYSFMESSPVTPVISDTAVVHKQRAPRRVKSKHVEAESNESSTSFEMHRAESELLKRIMDDEYNKEDLSRANTPAKKQVSGTGSGSGGSNSEEEISIDVVHVVFSNPTQVQRLKTIVATLKGALGCAYPESATFHSSNSSCGSSSEVSSKTVDQLSPMSNNLKSEISRPPGYYNFPSNVLNFERNQSMPRGVTGHAGVAQRLYFHSTESPQQAFYRNNYSSHKNQQQNVAGKIFSNQKAESLQEQQNEAQHITSNVSQTPAVNSQAKPGLSNDAQKVAQEPFLQHDQNQVPSKSQQENNYSLQKQNVANIQKQNTGSTNNLHKLQNQPVVVSQNGAVVQKQQTGSTQNSTGSTHQAQKQQTGFNQNLYQAQNQPVDVSQNPRHELNTMPPISTSQNQPQQEYQIRDPRLTSYLNFCTVGNQMPWTSENQMPSTSGSHIPVSLGNKIPQSLRKDHLSDLKNFGNGLSQKKTRRIYRHVNPSSIRRQWSISHAKPNNKVQVCLVPTSDNK